MTVETRVWGLSKTGSFLKREFFDILPTIIYFLVGFNLIAFFKHLILLEDGIVYSGAAEAIVGALLVAKVVFLADKLPIVKLVRGRPLIGPVLYRSALYTLFVFLTQMLEIVIGNTIHAGSVAAGLAAAGAGFIWEHFLVIYLWVFVLFFIYMCDAELRREFNLPPIWKLLTDRRVRDR